MPGYEYGEKNSGYYKIYRNGTNGNLYIAHYWNNIWQNGTPIKEYDESMQLAFREFSLGDNSNGSPTTEKGNNESLL